MEISFYHDPETGLPQIYGHRVSESEVVELFRRSPLRLKAHEGAMLALGRTAAGRYLRVIYRQKRREILVITAYDLSGKALAAFRRRRRRHGDR